MKGAAALVPSTAFRLEVGGELGLQVAEPAGAPREVVGPFARDDEPEAAGHSARQRQDLRLETAIDLLGANAQSPDELERVRRRQRIGEEDAQEPLVTLLEVGNALAAQPLLERGIALVGQAVDPAWSIAARRVGADDVAALFERGELRIPERRTQPRRTGCCDRRPA